MKKYLATTGMSSIWDTRGDILFLGPWCLTDKNNKNFIRGKVYSFIPSPWQNALGVKEAADYCYKIYEDILFKLCERLNLLHSTSYSVKYWRIILGSWLLHFISLYFDRYKRMENAVKVCPDLWTNVLPQDEYVPVLFDSRDFFRVKFNKDYFNLKLFSFAAYDICPKNLVIIDSAVEKFKEKSCVRNGLKGRMFFKFVMEPMDLCLKNDHIILSDMYHLSWLDMCFVKLKAGIRSFSFKNFSPLSGIMEDNYSYEKRNLLKLPEGLEGFERSIFRLIPLAIPKAFVENYRFYKSNAESLYGSSSVKTVGSSVGWHDNDEFHYYAARAVEDKASIVEFQHGGGYGTALALPLEDLSFEKDIFYTWGWSSENGKTKNLPSPHLSKIKDSHRPSTDKILFIGGGIPKYHYRFHTIGMPDDMPDYCRNKKIFFQNLEEGIRQHLIYRPCPVDYELGMVDAIEAEYPEVKLALKGPAVNWMRKSKLVVIDYPLTAFLEALTINVPCVFYWDHDVYMVRKDADSYFEMLREAGIVYKSPMAAAKKVNEIFIDPINWWHSTEVQSARSMFCERYAFARKDWMDIWVKELRALKT